MGSLSIDELTDMREPIRRLCADRFDRSAVRESGRPEPVDPGAWQALADVGVLGALAPEELGGTALAVAEVAALVEECGRGLAPGPIVWSILAATVLDGVADGSIFVTGAIPGGDGPLVIEHGAHANRILLIHRTAVTVHAAAALAPTPVQSVDPLTPLATGRHLDAADRANELGGPELACRWRALGACLAASYLVGAARLALELAVRHASDRRQFGRPIAGFQAVKHLLADVLVGIELAAAAVSEAADQLDAGEQSGDDDGAGRAASGAKLLAGDAAARAAKTCIQIHGGMGYTWEADPHLVWKRTMIYANAFGGGSDHAQRIAATLGARA